MAIQSIFNSTAKLAFAVLAVSVSVVLSATTPFSGQGTFFEVGLGSCGTVNSNSEMIGALNAVQYTSNSDVCGKCAMVSANGKSVMVKLMDKCPECAFGSIDLSPSAFNILSTPSVGRIPISWVMADCSSGAATGSPVVTAVDVTPAAVPVASPPAPAAVQPATTLAAAPVVAAPAALTVSSEQDNAPADQHTEVQNASVAPTTTAEAPSPTATSSPSRSRCWRKNRPDKNTGGQ